MKHLILYRHAKSDWGNPVLSDHARPLARRGEMAALKMGRWLAQTGALPDLILCSDAVRTRATLDLTLPELVSKRASSDPCIEVRADLYLAEARDILEVVRQRAETAQTVMVIAHNPGLHALAMTLARLVSEPSEQKLVDALMFKFPTAAMAVLDLDGHDYRKRLDNKCVLRAFQVPRSLP
ncbi:MAG: histidine phosphatase family protein [Pseudomonadota bacterium]